MIAACGLAPSLSRKRLADSQNSAYFGVPPGWPAADVVPPVAPPPPPGPPAPPPLAPVLLAVVADAPPARVPVVLLWFRRMDRLAGSAASPTGIGSWTTISNCIGRSDVCAPRYFWMA